MGTEERQLEGGSRPRRRIGRGARLLVWWSILAPLGWSVLLLSGVLITIEKAGLMRTWVRQELAARLGTEPETLRIGDLEFAWTERSVRIDRLGWGGTSEDLMLEDGEVVLSWSPRYGLRVDRIIIGDGRVQISDELITLLNGIPRSDQDSELDIGRLPEFAIRRLAVTVEIPSPGSDSDLDAEAEQEPLEIDAGTVDGVLVHDEGGMRLVSEWQPPRRSPDDVRSVFVNGRFLKDEVLEFRASARELGFDASQLPPTPFLEAIKKLEPHAIFDLEASGRLEWGSGNSLPDVDATLALREGSLKAPMPDDGPAVPVEDLSMSAAISFRPERESSGEPEDESKLWRPEFWNVQVESSGRILETPVRAAARIGRDAITGNVADGWLQLPELQIDGPIQRVVRSVPAINDLDRMLEPEGTLDVAVGLAVPEGWRFTDDGFVAVETALIVRPGEDASVAYVGQTNPSAGGLRNQGFPLRVNRISGFVSHFHRPGSDRPERVGLHDLLGHYDEHAVTAHGSLSIDPSQEPDEQGRVDKPMSFNLTVASDGIPVDTRLEPAFAGLVGVSGCRRLWETYSPDGGLLGFELRFLRDLAADRLATGLTIDFKDVDMRWEPFPLPVQGVVGDLHLAVDGVRGQDFWINAKGTTTESAGEVSILGRTEVDGAASLAHFEVSAPGLDLGSREVLASIDTVDPALARQLGRATPSGAADLSVTYSDPPGPAPSVTLIELETRPRGCSISAEELPYPVGELRGLVSVALRERGGPELPEVEVGGVVHGSLPVAGAQIPVQASMTPVGVGQTQLTVTGGGVDLRSEGLLERVMGSVGSNEDDIGSVDLSGHVDFSMELPFGVTGGEAPEQDLELELYARLQQLGVGGVDMLENVDGPLVFKSSDGSLRASQVRASLGGSPVILSDLVLSEKDGEMEFETRLDARSLRIDRQHLEHFLDARTLQTLLEEVEARGWFDLTDTKVRIRTEDGLPSVALTGSLSLHDAFFRLGLPVSITSAPDVELDLIFEERRVRARASVTGLYGQVAGRQLGPARMQLTYVDPRLTIDAFQGQFEGGTLRSLATAGSRSSSFFAVDLEDPFSFSLATRLQEVDVGRLLGGVFRSDFANQGLLDGELRLDGDLSRLIDIRGRGSFRLRDTSLWAIPVFQALFAQLGFDTAGTFSKMNSSFTIEDGSIEIGELTVKSDLLSLVGQGNIDFDGSIDQNLQVRYSVVDRLTLLRRLLYQIQNSLIRISIRGTLSRPYVLIEGLFSQFFSLSKEKLQLPLPELAPLPVRF